MCGDLQHTKLTFFIVTTVAFDCHAVSLPTPHHAALYILSCIQYTIWFSLCWNFTLLVCHGSSYQIRARTILWTVDWIRGCRVSGQNLSQNFAILNLWHSPHENWVRTKVQGKRYSPTISWLAWSFSMHHMFMLSSSSTTSSTLMEARVVCCWALFVVTYIKMRNNLYDPKKMEPYRAWNIK